MADEWYKGRLPTIDPNITANNPRLGPGPKINPESRGGSLRRTVIPSTGQGRADYIKGTPDKSQPSIFPSVIGGPRGGPDVIESYLRDLLYNTRILSSFQTLGNAITARLINVGTTPTLLIPANKIAQAYRLLNQGANLAGTFPFFTIFPSASRVAGTYDSSSFTVTTGSDLRAWLDITVAATTLRIDVRTQDPLSGNFATAQTDIFSGSIAIGTYYARVGDPGVDLVMQFRAVVTGTPTFSVSAVPKNGVVTDLGRTVFIGDANVNTTNGYPIMPGKEQAFFLRENTALYGIISSGNIVIKVFELR